MNTQSDIVLWNFLFQKQNVMTIPTEPTKPAS